MTFEGYTLSCGKKGLKAQGVKAAGKRCKCDKMVGGDDGSANPPWWLTKTHEYQLAKSPNQSPQQWSSGLV